MSSKFNDLSTQFRYLQVSVLQEHVSHSYSNEQTKNHPFVYLCERSWPATQYIATFSSLAEGQPV